MTALFSFLKEFESHETSHVEKTTNQTRRIYKLRLAIPPLNMSGGWADDDLVFEVMLPWKQLVGHQGASSSSRLVQQHLPFHSSFPQKMKKILLKFTSFVIKGVYDKLVG